VSDVRRSDVIRDERGRRVRELDRHGATVATLRWAADGRLAAAEVRLPDGSWLAVEPGAAHDRRWGVSDLLRLGEEPLTHCAAVDWACVDAIPPLAEPARLPPGAGTAVLNLIAALAVDQGRVSLAYRGPYPTEQLFLALLESFHWVPDDAPASSQVSGAPHPLARFMAGGLRWSPAPHTRDYAPGGVYVQSRERVDKLVWRGRAYYRATWQGVQRHALHRVREVGDRVHGSLWALEAPLEDHLVVARDGTVLDAALPPPDAVPVRPLAPAVATGVAAIVVASSAPPLRDWLRGVAAELTFEWAPLSGDLAVLTPDRARLSHRLRRAVADRLPMATTRAERLRLGVATLAELAHALGDGLRARAQARLAAAPEAVQAEALADAGAPDEEAAREIAEAAETLLDDAGQLLA
jgi:hypothetical protein